jgi:mono/diheme cytochrome c family protein
MIRQVLVGIVATALAASVAQAQRRVEKVPIQSTPIKATVMYDEYCAVCHGREAKGDGPYAADLKTRPADLTRISARNGGVFQPVKVARYIDGLDETPGSRDMPLWRGLFKSLDSRLASVRTHALVEHLKTLQTN